jgi:hypothetical protein
MYLICLDFFLWVFVKDAAYYKKVQNMNEVCDTIVRGAECITKEILANTWQETEYCLDVSCVPSYVGPCHHSMAHPLVAHTEDGLQIWMVAANILNKQSQTASKGWSSSLGIGQRANNSCKITPCYNWTTSLE